jgi:hypothetical protein
MGRTGIVAKVALIVAILIMSQGCAGVLEYASKIAQKSSLHKEWKKEKITRKGIKTMQERFIYDQKGKKAYMPFIYGMKDFVEHIFAVPSKNAVGTNDLDNAISLIKFKEVDNNVDYEIVKRDFLEEVNGEYEFGFSPLYSDEEIAYTQTKWFVFANLKTKHVTSTEPLFVTMGEFIRSFVSLDAKARLFCVERITPAAGEFYSKKLEIYHLQGEKFDKKGEIPAGFHDYYPGYTQPWQIHNGLIFTYDSAANKILCHDSNLKPSSHLFSEVFNRNNSKFRKLKEFKIHPTLSFGLVVEEGKDLDWSKLDKMPPEVYDSAIIPLRNERDRHILYLLRWDTQDQNKQYIPLHSDIASLISPIDAKQYSDFQFSPDGKWLVFRDETTDRDNPCFIALPVDEKKPSFFREPLYLGQVLREGGKPTTTAWIKDPLSFVVCDGLALYKWELGNINQARVIKSDKDVVPLK